VSHLPASSNTLIDLNHSQYSNTHHGNAYTPDAALPAPGNQIPHHPRRNGSNLRRPLSGRRLQRRRTRRYRRTRLHALPNPIHHRRPQIPPHRSIPPRKSAARPAKPTTIIRTANLTTSSKSRSRTARSCLLARSVCRRRGRYNDYMMRGS
jgi:hypothetical protein